MGDLTVSVGTSEDTREWVTVTEAVKMLGLSRKFVLKQAKERQITRRQETKHALFFLKSEIASWADFRNMRRQWLKKYQGEGVANRWREQLDAETARRLFIPTEEAAMLLGISVETVRSLARRGRLLAYQNVPGRPGSRLWFSRRAVLQLKEDPDRIRRQAEHWKGRAAMPRSVDKGMQLARTVREAIPKDWLTTREAAERLGVSVSRMRALRLTGRIQGKQMWRKYKPLRFWYFPISEVERVLEWRRQEKELAPEPRKKAALRDSSAERDPLGATEAADAGGNVSATLTRREEGAAGRGKRTIEYEDIGAGPEPKWACDDVDLTRAFFLLDRPGD